MFLLLSIFFIAFTDKQGSQPIDFSARAQAQRIQWSIPTDSLDYAVSSTYVDSLRQFGATVLHTSRWMNGTTVAMPDSLAEKVAQWSFVREIELTQDSTKASSVLRRKLATTSDTINYGLTITQLSLYNLPPLHAAGYIGQNILMAICDAGFNGYDTLSCFNPVHCLGTYDFSGEKKGFFASSDHGTMCLSTIAAIKSNYMGVATEADYVLMRSEENNAESPKEMDNLVAAMEKADSLGVNIFSVSLGYFNFDNPAFNLSYKMMDGQQTRVARAATIGARKGMLMVIAVGNEGNHDWHYLTTPSDADSVLSVGAVDVDSVIASFSGRGYSYDGRVKPEACAVGFSAALVTPEGTVTAGNGTSFATPLMAGLAASLWSALPTAPAMEIRERIIRSCDRYSNPDSDYGYGIPNAYRAWKNPTSLSDAPSETEISSRPRKLLIQGQIYIELNGRYYSILGN